MAKLGDVQVTISIETEPAQCSLCSAPTKVLVYPQKICANCWGMDILKKQAAKMSEFS